MPASPYNRRIEPGTKNRLHPDLWPSPHPRAGITDPTVTIDGGPHDAAAEHHSPEESTALLRAELDACRAEILRLRAVRDRLRSELKNGSSYFCATDLEVDRRHKLMIRARNRAGRTLTLAVNKNREHVLLDFIKEDGAGDDPVVLRNEVKALRAKLRASEVLGTTLFTCAADVLRDVERSAWGDAATPGGWKSFGRLRAALDGWRAR